MEERDSTSWPRTASRGKQVFRAILRGLSEGLLVTSSDGLILEAGASFFALAGQSRENLLGSPLVRRLEQLGGDASRLWIETERRALESGGSPGLVISGLGEDGTREALVRAERLDLDEPSATVILSYWRDVTEPRRMEAELDASSRALDREIAAREQVESDYRRSNRGLMVLSRCIQALIRAPDEASLMRDICRIIVEVGGYRLAWVGLAQADAPQRVIPVARWGHEAGYLDMVDITWADTERGRGPTGRAIRTGRPWVMRDIHADPAYKPWREEALRRGYLSSIALPLQVRDRVIGALNIYSAAEDAFDYEEFSLLTELADDLSLGIATLRERAGSAPDGAGFNESET
ncbi:MAG: GAF domain-containing protein [Proteobacteria bacterium]|nr:GAF domain-containing protein [Pseudomonadota bacterium]